MLKRQTEPHGFVKAAGVVLVFAWLMAACGPAQTGLSPEQAQAQVATSVAQTVEAQNGLGTDVALTVTAMAPAATATQTATETPLFLPTLTPLATVTPFVVQSGGGGGGGGGGSGGGGSGSCRDKQRCCDVVDQEPEDWPDPHSILKVGDKLDVNFDIKNVGTLTWDPAWTWTYWRTAVDSSEPANADLTTNSVGLQATLGVSVKPGDYIRLGIEETAPDFQGRDPIKIETHWAITGDGARFCTPYSYIEVIRPGMTP